MGALAYLDIGPDNGGILLNLSEDGLALQAVAPLHGQKEVQLAIQLPHSEARIETAAEIVWLGATSRQAGVRFLNLSAEARTQIREWVESQAAPSASSAAQAPVVEPAAKPIEPDSSAHGQDGIPDSRRAKWLGLMEEFERQTAGQEESESESEPLKATPQLISEIVAPVAKRVPVLRPRPEIVPKPRTSAASISLEPLIHALHAEQSAEAKLAADSVREPSPSIRPPTLQDAASATAQSSAESPARARDVGSVRTPDAVSAGTSIAPCAAKPEADSALARTAVEAVSEEKKSDQSSESGEAPYSRARNQLVLVSLFALFSILCFGIGTWVGRIPAQVEAVKRATAPSDAVAQIPTSSSVAPPVNISEQPNSQTTRPIGVERPSQRIAPARLPKTTRANRRETGVFAEQAKVAVRPSQPGVVLPVHEETQPSAERSSPAILSSDQPTTAAPGIINPTGSAPSAAPEENAKARVVNGYVLQPSDRFVPCHLTYRVDPTYPPDAKRQGVEGTVKIHLAIAADGSVESEKLISGPPELVSAALEAAKYWQYLPALLNGQPVPTETDVEVVFRLPR